MFAMIQRSWVSCKEEAVVGTNCDDNVNFTPFHSGKCPGDLTQLQLPNFSQTSMAKDFDWPNNFDSLVEGQFPLYEQTY